jgi:hypothetical protein
MEIGSRVQLIERNQNRTKTRLSIEFDKSFDWNFGTGKKIC